MTPKESHGREPLGALEAQGIPWEGTLGSPREPMGGDPREPKGAHGSPWSGTLGSPRDPMGGDPWEPKGPHGRGPLGAQGIAWERTLVGSGTTKDQFGASWGLQEPFWRFSVTKRRFKKS